jgi:hypothetical protein
MRELILETISKDGTEWNEIVKVIKENTNIKNFLKVRNVIQQLKDENLIYRTANLYKEIYVKDSAPLDLDEQKILSLQREFSKLSK